MAYIGVGSVYSITAAASGGSSAATSWIEQQTPYLRVVVAAASTSGPGAAVYVGVTTNAGYNTQAVSATAVDATNAKIVATDHGDPVVLSLGQVCSQRVVGITTGTTTYVDFPEGTGSQFIKGQSVSLTCENQTGFGTYIRDVPIIDVLDTGSAGYNYHASRVAIGTDTSPLNLTYNSDNFAELRSTFRVTALSAIPTGATVLVQQVQMTGG